MRYVIRTHNIRKRGLPLAKQIDVLDHGFVKLLDHMGDDDAIDDAARISYVGLPEAYVGLPGKGTRLSGQRRGLIRYLMRNWHTSPFEQVEFKFAMRMPLVVARQHIRHRTANLNEISGRYAVIKDDFYVPDIARITRQSESNKQGSSTEILEEADRHREELKREAEEAFLRYNKRIDAGMAKELARINLPLSAYTTMVWKIDLHNLFHYLRLRLHHHAQKEIRVYAEALATLIRPIVPIAYEAFEDYRLYAADLSRMELEVLREYTSKLDAEMLEKKAKAKGMSKREITSFLSTLGCAGDNP